MPGSAVLAAIAPEMSVGIQAKDNNTAIETRGHQRERVGE